MSAESPENNEIEVIYGGFTIRIYSIADFYPRGTFRDQKFPPYPLSEEPQELTDPRNFFEQVQIEQGSVRPLESVQREFEWAKRYDRPFDVDDPDQPVWRLDERKQPEEYDEILTLDYLRRSFLRKDERKYYTPNDRIALISHSITPDRLYVVDISRKAARYLNKGTIESDRKDSQQFVRYQEEKKKVKDRKLFLESQQETSFEETDLVRPKPHTAKDSGSRKYKDETKNFFNRMTDIDLITENVLKGHVHEIVPTIEAIRRLSRRMGRNEVNQLLNNLRNKSSYDHSDDHFFNELAEDIHFYNRLTTNKHAELHPSQVESAIKRLFIVEKAYLNVIFDTPWNKTGPQAIDDFLEVFWHRYSYNSLELDDKGVEESIKRLKGRYYKEAAIDRKTLWYRRQGYPVDLIKDIAELGLSPKTSQEKEEVNKRIRQEMGPVKKYVARESLREDITRRKSSHYPLGLSLLIWRTLKYSSPQQWKTKGTRTISFQDMRYGPVDETVPDPRWMEIGDHQGRLILAGETLNEPLSHPLAPPSDANEEARTRTAFALEKEGILYDANMLEETSEAYLNQDEPKKYASIADNFQRAVAQMNFSDLTSRIISLPAKQRALALHRLGYRVPETLETDDSESVEPFSEVYLNPKVQRVKTVIHLLFDDKPYRYYEALRKATDFLKKDPKEF